MDSQEYKGMRATHKFIPVGILTEHAHAILFSNIAASPSDMRRRIVLTCLVWRRREARELIVGTLDRHVMQYWTQEASQQVGKGREMVHPSGLLVSGLSKIHVFPERGLREGWKSRKTKL